MVVNQKFGNLFCTVLLTYWNFVLDIAATYHLKNSFKHCFIVVITSENSK